MKNTARRTLMLIFASLVVGCAPTGGAPSGSPLPAGAEASWPDSLREPDPGANLRGMLVVTQNSGSAVAFLNPDTKRVFAYARVGFNPRELAVSPDQGRLYVVNYDGGQFGAGSISVLSTSSRQEIDRLDLYPYGRFHGLACARSGVYLYAASETRRSVLEINLLSRQVERTFVLPHGIPHEVALDPSETRLYVTDAAGPTLFAVNLTGGDVQETRVGAGPEEVVLAPDGSAVWVANRDDGTVSVLDPYTLGSIALLGSGRAPVRIALSADGNRAYVVNAGEATVAVFDARTRARLGIISVGTYPLGIALDADGRHGYVASTRDDELSVIDLATNSVTDRIRVGPEPFGLLWVDGGR
ncbi:MAG: YncE family protein [Candidatus Eisenbacteria bacterium]